MLTIIAALLVLIILGKMFNDIMRNPITALFLVGFIGYGVWKYYQLSLSTTATGEGTKP